MNDWDRAIIVSELEDIKREIRLSTMSPAERKAYLEEEAKRGANVLTWFLLIGVAIVVIGGLLCFGAL